MQEIHPFYRSYNTIREMLNDRGYNTDSKLPLNAFNTVINTPGYKIIYKKKNDPNWSMQIFFVKQTVNSDSSNLGKKDIETYKKIMEKNKVNAAILVLLNIDVTSYARKEMECLKPDFWIECFSTNSLQINITHHTKVPKHILLSDKEKMDFLQKYSLNIADLNKIERNDPVALYFAAQPGQVFKIAKVSESNGQYEQYRVVI